MQKLYDLCFIIAEEDGEQSEISEETTNHSQFLSRKEFFVLFENGVRDFAWTIFSAGRYNFKFQNNSYFSQQMLAQWFYSTAAMCASGGALATGLYFKFKGTGQSLTKNDVKKLVIAICAASLAVFSWDLAQTAGIQLGLSIGLSNEEAGYFAAIFTGLAEGPTQYLVNFLMEFLLFNKDWKQEYTDYNNYLKSFGQFFTELGWSAVPGMAAGTVWQLVYHAFNFDSEGITNSAASIFKSIGAGTAVSAAVGTMNFIHGKATSWAFGNTGLFKCFSKNHEQEMTEIYETSLLLPNKGV